MEATAMPTSTAILPALPALSLAAVAAAAAASAAALVPVLLRLRRTLARVEAAADAVRTAIPGAARDLDDAAACMRQLAQAAQTTAGLAALEAMADALAASAARSADIVRRTAEEASERLLTGARELSSLSHAAASPTRGGAATNGDGAGARLAPQPAARAAVER
jgi:ABC-type transporter Mla subunit MlaD